MARQARTGRLLIVDDDRSLRLIPAWGLEKLGYRVGTASGHRQAVAAAFVEKPVQLGRLHTFFKRGDVIAR